MSNTRTSTVERNGNSNKGSKLTSPWSRAITGNSEWHDKVTLHSSLCTPFLTEKLKPNQYM